MHYETKRIRTSDPQFRKLMLYPAELWSRHCKKTQSEKGGFEPPDPLPGQLLSREPDSTALAPLQSNDSTVNNPEQKNNERRERDSNPRGLAPQQFSRLPPSTARTSLPNNSHGKRQAIVRLLSYQSVFYYIEWLNLCQATIGSIPSFLTVQPYLGIMKRT